jgi:hypothetical protein
MLDANTILTSAVVSAAVTSLLGPIVQSHLSRRQEKRKRDFEIKYQEYKRYVEALDRISAEWTVRGMAMIREAQEHFNAVVVGDGDPGEHLEALSRSLGAVTGDMFQSMAELKGDLVGLKLICSDELLHKVQAYISSHEALGRELTSQIGRIGAGSLAASDSDRLLEQGVRAESLKDEIVRQMRYELRIH